MPGNCPIAARFRFATSLSNKKMIALALVATGIALSNLASDESSGTAVRSAQWHARWQR